MCGNEWENVKSVIYSPSYLFEGKYQVWNQRKKKCDVRAMLSTSDNSEML